MTRATQFDLTDCDQCDLDHLGRLLTQRLDGPSALPRATARTSLAYGRHRGPIPLGTRRAAVAIALYRNELGQWIIPLTLRPTALQHHGGQVCLPGGRIERGEDAYQAALREYEEELGLEPHVAYRCGQLPTQYVFASGNSVRPVVVVLETPDRPWHPDPVEVDQVIEMPLRLLGDHTARVAPIRQIGVRNQGDQVGSIAMRTPAVRFQEHHIWGATALILDQLAQILHP